MFSLLYNIIVRPLEQIIELFFYFMLKNSDMNIIYSLVGLSLMINLLSLPLYMNADRMQKEERDMQKQLKPMSDHIDKSFSGDERFMIKAAYYRLYHYSPLSVFKGSFSLLLQIPFFTAAYHYLTHLELLKQGSFAFITNLGEPDRLFTIGGFSVNILPILMTLINLISGAIYTRGFSLKDKLQVYGLALVFLVLLYNSPSGLVIYWLCNNLFSLFRNIITKFLPRPDIIAALVYVLAGLMLRNLLSILFLLPLLMIIFRSVRKNSPSSDAAPADNRIFLLGSIYMTLLTGAWIPVSVLSASPADFVNMYGYISPFHYLATTFCVYAGLFLLWGSVIRYMCRGKRIYDYILLFIAFFSTATFLVFSKDSGTISSMLLYSHAVFPGYKRILLACAALPLILIFVYILLRKFKKFAVALCLGLCAAAAVISVKGCLTISSVLKNIDLSGAVAYEDSTDSSANVTPVLNLSDGGRNVVVIMLDKAISGYIPYILKEKPELKECFDGFTWYPDTASFAMHTNLAFFPLMGGYEYTPAAMAARTDESLASKTDQALKVLPSLFYNEGYEVTLCDIPYAGMQQLSDMSIYNDYAGMKTYLLQGRYNAASGDIDVRSTTEHNFIWYSISKIIFPAMQEYVYNKGYWLSTALMDRAVLSDNVFMENYAVLDLMPELTTVSADTRNTFTFIDNNATQEFQILQMPDYVPDIHVDNSAYYDGSIYEIDDRRLPLDNDEQLSVYHVNMASLLRIGEWLDYLRANGAYDNTRIIIASDHGQDLGQFEDLLIDDTMDAQAYNALLLIKDFDAHGSNVDYSFMTNADVPFLSTDGIISDPVNPFTGNALSMEPKASGIDITTSHHHGISDALLGDNGYAFDTSDGSWYHVSGSIFDRNNWSKD